MLNGGSSSPGIGESGGGGSLAMGHSGGSALSMYGRECSGSVVGCLIRDRRAAGLSLTSVTALLSLSKTHLF